MRIENGKFYVITEKGDFVSADAVDGFECGDEVEIKNEVMPSYFKPIASIAAAVIIVFGGIYGYHVPVRYVDVCINPEIQLSLNVFDRVVEVQGKNSDGRKIASAKKLKNENVTEAIGDIVSSARTLGYMSNGDEGERDVIVSVFGSGADELSKKIPLDNVRVVDEDDCEMAKKQDIPVGKYVLMNELAEADETQSIEKVKDMSVKQIIDRIDDVKKADKPVQTPPPVSAQPTAAPIETPDVSEPTAQPQEQTIKRSAPLAEIIHKPTIAPSKTAAPSKSSARSSSSKSTAKSSSKTNTSSSKSSTVKSTSSPTAKPSESPSSSTGILFPTEKPKATLLPSFDNVTRPAANSDKSTDKNTASSAADKNDSSVNADKKNTNKQQPSGNSGSQNPPSEEKQENKPQTSNEQKTPERPTESVNQPPQNTSAQKEQPQTKPSGSESSANSGSQERNESAKPKENSSYGGAELQSAPSSKASDKPSPASLGSDSKPSAPRTDSAKQPSAPRSDSAKQSSQSGGGESNSHAGGSQPTRGGENRGGNGGSPQSGNKN